MGDRRVLPARARRHLAIASLLLLPAVLSGAVALQSGRTGSTQGTTKNPHGPLNVACVNCHTLTSWKPIRQQPDFDHSRTKYPLLGRHKGVDCTDCHTNLVFANTSTQCAQCHADIHRGQFGASCDRCHSLRGWTVSQTAIQSGHQNRFPLVLAHAVADCEACHKGAATGQFQGLSTQCYSCHERDFQTTASPNHVTGRFSTTCTDCHTMASWAGAKFDHSQTGFPLTGAHTTVACASCHAGNNYTLTSASTACASCHMTDYQKTGNPNHVTSRLSTSCDLCHNVNSWANAIIDHSQTGFPLAGAHVTVACAACHVNNNFNLTSANTACVSCHMPDYQKTTSPNHAAGSFPTTCEQCHNVSAWAGAAFDHARTGFALAGAHTTVACIACHVNNNYALTSANTACVSCHMPDYQKTTSPNHAAGSFPTTCEQCHNVNSWTGAGFDHSKTGFPLTGAHTAAACSSCHVNNNYSLTNANAACSSCHTADYQKTTNPNHVAASFPTDCSVCHSTTNWSGASFNHASTGWALTGAHAGQACSACHVNNNYTLNSSSTACINCHRSDYTGATSPVNHSGFPTSCEQCHSTQSWAGATFNHSSTGFALTGAHTSVACASCHVNNNYNLTSANTACVSCHQADYSRTTNPNHTSAGFPTTCSTCHTTQSWAGATFNHTWFPTSHGNANGVCATCHTNSSDYSVFQCTVCHSAGQTNPKHSKVSGYVFNSTNCYACHRSGRGGD